MNKLTRIVRAENGFQRIRGFEVVPGYDQESIKMPRRSTLKAAGYDIYNNTGKIITLQPGEISEPIKTCIRSYMLDDEYLAIVPRSGLGFKYSVRLVNTLGIIDCDFYDSDSYGEIVLKFHNQGNHVVTIEQHQAMAQGIFMKYLRADDDAHTVGGKRNGGFGSTDKKS